jgi:hypothetical protein
MAPLMSPISPSPPVPHIPTLNGQILASEASSSVKNPQISTKGRKSLLVPYVDLQDKNNFSLP